MLRLVYSLYLPNNISDIDILKKQIIDNVLVLVTKKNVTQREIFQEITTALEQASKELSKVPVIYNATYGVFGTSKYFDEYLKVMTSNSDAYKERTRTCMAKLMMPFGKHVAEKYPELYEIVFILHNKKVESLVDKCKYLHYYTKMIDTIKKNKSSLQDHIDSRKPEDRVLQNAKKPSEYCFKDKFCCWWNYKINDLIDLNSSVDVNKLIREYEDQIKACEIDLPPEIKQALATFVHDFESPNGKIKSPFMDLIVLDKIEDAWNSQHFFDIGAIEFLSFAKTKHPKVYDYFKDGLITDHENTYELLGLLAASGQYAMLAIDYVPNLINWHISDYDGKETVQYVYTSPSELCYS